MRQAAAERNAFMMPSPSKQVQRGMAEIVYSLSLQELRANVNSVMK